MKLPGTMSGWPGQRRGGWCRVSLLCLLLALLALAGSAAAAPDLSLEVSLDPQRRELVVSAELAPRASEYRFALHPSLQLDAASFAGKALSVRSIGTEAGQRWWQVRLPAAARRGGLLQLRYHGRLPALDESLDHRQVLQRLGPMASVRGSFLPAGSGWYPLPPTELFSYQVSLSLPAGQRALVAGRLLEESPRLTDEGAQQDRPYRARFEFAQGARGIDLLAGPWQISERMETLDDGRSLRLRTYFPASWSAQAELAALAERWLADSGRYIERYHRLIGAYPFAEFSVVASPLPTGFGMAGMTYLGEQLLPLPFIRASSLGHEILHNWWGNGVLVDYRQGNWAEGLTTFMADYAYAEEQGEAAARAMRLGWLRDQAAVPAGEERSLRDFRSRTHGAAAAVGYGKAAMLFVMLRDQLGEAVFLRGVRRFWHEQRFQRASWHELEQAFAAEAGRDLGPFFRQWLDGRGSDALQLKRASFVAATDGLGGQLKLEIDGQGAERDYWLPLEVEQRTGGRERHWLALAGAESGRSESVLDLAERPRSVGLDVDFRLWRRLLPDQLPLTLRQWMLSPQPRYVVLDEDEAMQAGAAALSARLFERPAQPLAVADLLQAKAEVLLIGTETALAQLATRLALPPAPQSESESEQPAFSGSARIWTGELAQGPKLLLVAVRDVAALRALQRPLPHYGSQSWLLFEGSKLLERGVWEAANTMQAVDDLTPLPAP